MNKPPYTITDKAADYLAKIVESVTRLEFGTGFKRNPRLHRQNRMRTIHSSLAIEGNTLSLGEVTAILAGKVVSGTQEEIKEVKNAYAAYDHILNFDPYSVDDFLKAHQLMTGGLLAESGRFRSGDVGVFDGAKVIHIGARPQLVAQLMADLFAWAKKSDLHPVLKSAIIHYEIETIHPFADGNGRMGRLWQTLLLAKRNALFAWIPMESVVYQMRPQYYQAIEAARKVNDSGAFIEFTLAAVLESISAQVTPQVATLLACIKGEMSRQAMQEALALSDREHFRRVYLAPALEQGWIEMTVPDKPNSRLQKYRLTPRGRVMLASGGTRG